MKNYNNNFLINEKIVKSENINKEINEQNKLKTEQKNNTEIFNKSISNKISNNDESINRYLLNKNYDNKDLSKILSVYNGIVIYDEILPIHLESIDCLDDSMAIINKCYVYSIENIIEVLINILIADRNFTRILDPYYRSKTTYDINEPLSPAFNDLLCLINFILLEPNGIKIVKKNIHKFFTYNYLFSLLFQICVHLCDQESRMYNFILDNFYLLKNNFIDYISLILEQDRVDILDKIINVYFSDNDEIKNTILENATNYALICINNNSLLCYSYLTLIADSFINYKYLLQSKLNIKPNMFAYTIDIDKNINFITNRYLSDKNKLHYDTIINNNLN
jgi:hypothetical protein